MKLSGRSAIQPFHVMEVMKAAAEKEATGTDVIHLEVGQPATPAPEPVLAAAATALKQDRLGYTDALGIGLLRERIARHYRDWYKISVAPERIIVTTGSSGGFLLAFLAAFDAGDKVAIGAPYYPGYRNILTALDIEPVIVETGPQDRFQPTVDLLGAPNRPVQGLLIASPANPTGTMLDAAALTALSDHCTARDILLISDEIYHGICFDRPAVSVLEVTDTAFVINSFSKYFSMTGWRLGWMVVPPAYVRGIERLTQNLFISPPALSQMAAVAAFDCEDELEANVARYRANRDVLLDYLPRAGFTDLAPAEGAFYIYANTSKFTDNSPEFCRRMLAEIGVAVTPGIDFDDRRGTDYCRISFAGGTDEMVEAGRRLMDWLR